MHVLLILLFSFPALAGPSGTLSATWSNATTRENGQSFVPGEFQGTRVTYYRNAGERTFDTEGESIRISNIQKGWWSIYLMTMSHCHIANDNILTLDTCFSDPTPTMRVKVR